MFDKHKVITLVNMVVEHGAGYTEKKIGHAMPDEPGIIIKSFGCTPEALPFAQELCIYIESNSNLSKIFTSQNYNLGMLYTPVTPGSLVEWLYNRSVNSNTESTVELLEKFISQAFTPANQIISVSGIEVTEKINIIDDIQLVPINELGQGFQKHASSPKKIHGLPGHSGSYVADEKFPKCAIIKPIRLKTTIDNKEDRERASKHSDYSILNDICDFFFLYNNTISLPFSSWIEIEEWVPCLSNKMSGMTTTGVEISPGRNTQFRQEDWDLIRPIYEKFLQLPTNHAMSIKVSLKRLKKAQLRHNIVDMAIEIGVAIETILLEENDRSELTYKIKIRSARYLEKSIEKRTEISDLFSAIYLCRSEAVHRGTLKDSYKVKNRGKVNTKQLLQEATKIIIQIIVKIINEQKFPIWSEVELG